MKRTVHLTGEQRKQIAIDVLKELKPNAVSYYDSNKAYNKVLESLDFFEEKYNLKDIEIKEEI